jgi:hypothetical protein
VLLDHALPSSKSSSAPGFPLPRFACFSGTPLAPATGIFLIDALPLVSYSSTTFAVSYVAIG